MKIWYVEFPTYQYNEDVKELARKNNLKIVDAIFQGENEQCVKPPKLTKIKKDIQKIEESREEIVLVEDEKEVIE